MNHILTARSQFVRTATCALVGCAVLCAPLATTAQVRRAVQVVTPLSSRSPLPVRSPQPRGVLPNSRSVAQHGKVKIGPHTRFGTIVSLQANSFVMETRAHKSLTVDDTVPLQTGTYSFPLFVGKLVMVTGDVDATGILHADTITRVPFLETHTPGDH